MNEITIQPIEQLLVSHIRTCQNAERTLHLHNNANHPYARTLLLKGTSITATCYECGFKDYADFVKVFSKINGVSPGRYAKNIPAYKKEASSSKLLL